MKRAVPPKAVVFDLDGTLIDSLSLVLEALGHALAPFGRGPGMEIFPSLGGPSISFVPKLVDDPRHVPVVMDRLNEYHRTNEHLLAPFPGARPMLERLRAAGVLLGIWTGRDRETAVRVLACHALTDYFGAVVCGDDLSTHKPDPEGLQRILGALKTAPADTLLVGDADVDVLGGVACGVDTLLIARGRQTHAAVRARCWGVVASPQDAYAAVLACAAPC